MGASLLPANIQGSWLLATTHRLRRRSLYSILAVCSLMSAGIYWNSSNALMRRHQHPFQLTILALPQPRTAPHDESLVRVKSTNRQVQADVRSAANSRPIHTHDAQYPGGELIPNTLTTCQRDRPALSSSHVHAHPPRRSRRPPRKLADLLRRCACRQHRVAQRQSDRERPVAMALRLLSRITPPANAPPARRRHSRARAPRSWRSGPCSCPSGRRTISRSGGKSRIGPRGNMLRGNAAISC